MAGAAAVAPLKSDAPIHNLLRAKNGLDNQDHFREPTVESLLTQLADELLVTDICEPSAVSPLVR